MSQDRAAARAAERLASGTARVAHAWRALPYERRLTACAALGLFVTLFLPWYQETVIAPGRAKSLQSASASLTGWAAFSLVEAAVLLVSAGVLTLLFQRAEGRAFHLPGGDGWVITAAGFWTCVLIVWRIFDKQGTSSHGRYATTSGIEWGIFVALAVAAFLAYTGWRIRAAHRPEPPLPGDKGPLAADRPLPETEGPSRRADGPARRRPVSPARSAGQVRPPRPVAADDPPTRRITAADGPAPRPRRDVRADEQPIAPFDENGSED